MNVLRVVLSAAMLPLLAGCRTAAVHAADPMLPPDAGAAAGGAADAWAARMLTWNADLAVEVWDVSNGVRRAVAAAEDCGGYAENKTDYGGKRVSLRLRVKSSEFQRAVAAVESLGRVTYRHVAADDVTEAYVDVAARLKNKVALRDRLRQLLDKATDVRDILAIETELSRVQADIESMEGRMKSLKGRADMATIGLTIERRRILGPLGLALKAAWWGVEKLFVIRD